MQRILLFLSALFIATTAIAHTINWYVDGNIFHTTTCESGENVTPPTAPEKYGYTFRGWGEYIPVEYLESTGTQYIDTGVVANEKTEAEIQFLTDSPSYLFFVSTGGWSSNNFGLIVSKTVKTVNFYMNCDGYTDIGLITEGNLKLLLSGIYLNDAPVEITRGVIPSPTAFTTKYTIPLFGGNNSGTISSTKNKVYFFRLWQDGILVRDFIPVLDKYGTPCMYDKVEQKFYYNAGTGDFIAGPIIGE